MLLSVLALLAGCSQVVELEIDHYEEPCLCGEAHTTCMRTRESGEEDFGLMCFGIDGYEHAWGRTEVVEIRETEVLNPPADGSSIERSLVEVLSQTLAEPGTEYTLTFMGDLDDMGYTPLISYDAENTGLITGGPAFVCDPVEVCEDMRTLDEAQQDFSVTFRYADPISEPLLAVAVE